LNWRRKGKHFYRPEDLKPLYNLPPETYARLAPYVRISNMEDAARKSWSPGNSYPAIPSVIELNTADSTLLDRGVNGIGATLARKIVARRTALGGFIKHEQLLEVYRFPDTTFQKLKTCLHINMRNVHKMNLNAVGLAQMSMHPYVGESVAKNILLYKEGIGRYTHVEQLREVPLMSEEIYRKIAPYFVVE
jgi:DNA uptake protein ComE-like DNA-binding protein